MYIAVPVVVAIIAVAVGEVVFVRGRTEPINLIVYICGASVRRLLR